MSEKSVGGGSDGYVSILISEDKMEARASFYCGTGEGRELVIEQAESALNANNIEYGIIKENIEAAIETCSKENTAVKDIVIAKGSKPLKSTPEHINLKPEFFSRVRTVVRNDGSVDYKESSPFVMVKKGETVGKFIPMIPGKVGKTVLGDSIAFKEKDIQIFKAGENLEKRGDFLVSLSFGRFLITGDILSVTEVLEIDSDVDYHTGNISFAGDIVIDGVIHDGFRVAAGGSIICKKIIKNAEVLGRGDLQLDLGVKGRNKALVRINGSITAKFIEQGTVESRTGITVSTSIVSSKINTLGKLVLGQKGTIVTSTIIAEKGVEVYNLGRELCAPSLIWCGLSFVENRKLDHLKTRHEILLDKIAKLEMGRKPQVELVGQMRIIALKQEKEIESLEKNVYTYEDASIVVHGTLFTGTEIKICKLRKKIEKNHSRVKVKIDKEKNRIIISPI